MPATIVSLILCLATLTLWVRSYWRTDHFIHLTIGRQYKWVKRCGITRGIVQLQADCLWSPFRSSHDTLGTYRMHSSAGLDPDLEPFGYAETTLSNHITFPLWLPAILFAIAPATWVIRRRLRRPRPGYCVCGYDLRFSADRCPECGSPIAPPTRV